MFRTEIPFIPYPHQLPPSARLLTMGSCFAETIGSRLATYKVDALVNPFGTVFNPLAACQLLRAAAGEEVDWQQHLVEARGRWQSYDLHAAIGEESPVALLQRIQELVRETGEFLRAANVVVLTLGTAWVYRLLETGELVSNCHKLPAEKFTKELLTPDEIVNAVAETHAYLRRANPGLRFILTVSPVRHLKDTLTLNSVSKSALRIACHYLSELLPDVSYFPAYELLLDDLRDYRFYADDMLHPSKVAEEYIWERFTRTYFDAEFGRFKKEWHSLQQALAHRPLYAAAPEHRQFLESVLARLQRLNSQTAMQSEIADLQERLANLPVPVVPEPLPEFEDDEERIDIGEYASPPTVAPAVDALLVEGLTEDRAAASNDAEEIEEEDTIADAAAVAPPTDAITPTGSKKKRRSRGGAKRTARKRAALAALEVEAIATDTTTESSDVPNTLAPETAATPELPAAASADTAAAIPEAASVALMPEETTDPNSTPSTLTKSRRGRSAGQILADQKKRRGNRKAGATNSSSVVSGTVTNAPEVATATESTPLDTTTPPTPTSPVVTPASEPTIPAPEPTNETPLPTRAEANEMTTEPTEAPTPAPISAKPRKARPSRKKPAATVSPAPQEPVEAKALAPQVETSTESELLPEPATAPKKTTKPRPARKKPAAKAAPQTTSSTTSEPPLAAETPEAAKTPPKRRPPRKKPTSTDETPPAS